MKVGLVGFLKQILSLIRRFRLQISQKSETVASVGFVLRSPIYKRLHIQVTTDQDFCQFCSNVLILRTFFDFLAPFDH